ncbi:15-hydroxyprostaglandin dehydrogenase [NAD(+)]-like [Anticarsia gemmatalis]|uniref:15-hydroxyprostaglandin dehydrogenase [NAD(+)]-like n=1 Tax=Anticarsia gemmatalis TaxID=129554 RepID=UPI003F76CC4F
MCEENRELTNKIVLITGGAKGIGAAICVEVLKEGAKHVRILDLDEGAGVNLENEMNKQYGTYKVKFIKCDVTNDDELFGAFEGTKQEHGYLDVVVNNAGVINENNYAAIRKMVEINYIALANGTLKAIELMDKSKGGRGGTVINMASIAGLYPICPPAFMYSSTKTAVLQFTSCIGAEPLYTNTGIRVIALCFGTTDTSIFSHVSTFGGAADKLMEEVLKNHELQRVESAALGTVEAFKKGDSASVWLIHQNKPAIDITEDREKCHQSMARLLGR